MYLFRVLWSAFPRIQTKHRDLLCVNFRNQSECGKTRSKKHRSRTLITQSDTYDAVKAFKQMGKSVWNGKVRIKWDEFVCLQEIIHTSPGVYHKTLRNKKCLRSQSGNMIRGLFPPNSKVTLFKLEFAAAAITIFPT